MNLKVTLLLLSAVLLLMLGAGGASAYIGYLMGREALKVVTQPDTDSERNLNSQKPLGGSHKGLNILDERTILVNVYDHIYQKRNFPYQEQSLTKTKAAQPIKQKDSLIKPDSFPLQDKSQEVTLAISQAKIEGNSVVLDVNFRNESSQPVRFLYSFLDLRDEENRPLSAIADGLPGEIPPDSKNYKGKFIIPMTLLNNSQQISLSLQDYPEQRLTLQINSIPIAR